MTRAVEADHDPSYIYCSDIEESTSDKLAVKGERDCASERVDECDAVIDKLLRSPEPMTEARYAEAFAKAYEKRLRYVSDMGCWYRFDEAAWRPDRLRLAFHLTVEFMRRANRENKPQLETARFADAVEKIARARPELAVDSTAFDRDALLLGTPGGVVDLRTGNMRPAAASDMISKLALCASEPGEPVLWLNFLRETTGNDAELVRFLQQWCGYCLTGDTREHALLFIYGPGGNGKSVFINVVTRLLAEYVATADMDVFSASKYDRHPTSLAALRGARLVTSSETEEGRAWAEARIKHITGGDPITARFMRQDEFTYVPQFKLTIIGNHQPALRSVDDAVRRRFNIVPFTRKPASPDPYLESKLAAEAPRILNWMIDGALDWQRNGLVRPASVVAATRDYFDRQDVFGQWLEERCRVEPDNKHLCEVVGKLFASWRTYAEAAGEEPGSGKAFAGMLMKRGLLSERVMRKRGYRGIELKGGHDADE